MDRKQIENLIEDIWFKGLQVEAKFDPKNFWGEEIGLVEIEGGWTVGIFEDCGELDYIEWIKAPTGEEWSYLRLERMGIHNDLASVVFHRIAPSECGPWKPKLKPDGTEYTWPEALMEAFFAPLPFLNYLRSKGVLLYEQGQN